MGEGRDQVTRGSGGGSTSRKTRINLRDPRYPRRHPLRWMRTVLLLCWALIVAYLGTAALNVFQDLVRDPSGIANWPTLAHALLLPDPLAAPNTPPVALIPLILLVVLILVTCSWAVQDLARERKIESLREAWLLDVRAQETDKALTRAMRPLHAPELLIVPIQGSTPATRTPLLQDIITIGRESDNDIVIPDSSVSRHHLKLNRDGPLWRVTAMPGSTPLYVNAQQVTTALLRDGDQLIIGATVLRFESPLPPGQSLAADLVPRLAVSCTTASFLAPLREAQLTLGRALDCDVVVPSGIVGQHHAVFVRNSHGTYTIEDTGSRNGLGFEGKRVLSHVFQDRDRVTIGERSGLEVVTLTYVSSQISDARPEVEISGI